LKHCRKPNPTFGVFGIMTDGHCKGEEANDEDENGCILPSHIE
jgi:hypothetical protein